MRALLLAGDGEHAWSQLDGHSALEHLLRSLASVRRLQPLHTSVHIVVNQPDFQRLSSSSSSSQPHQFATMMQDLGLQAGNVISNGAQSRSQWQGEVADLQLGLQQAGMTTPVLVISCSMTVLPGFNMQRIVEHSLVRARDTVGIISLSSLQLLLLGTSGHCLARPADTVPVPLLAGIEPGSDAVSEGEWAVQPLLVLQPSTLRAWLPSCQASTLQQLAAHLLGKVALHGIELGGGALRVDTPAAVEVASRFVRFFCEAAAQYRATAGAARSSHQRSAVLEGTSDSPPPATLQGACTYMLETGGLFEGVANEFCRLHRGATASSSSLEAKLPATFYMTAYRRQAGSVLR